MGLSIFGVCDRESKLVQIRTDDAENYEECVFRLFGASESIRYDREPGFMSNFFREFSRIVGEK